MQNQFDRTLTILTDGEPVTGYARARLLGTERLRLYPSLFMLHLWNVAEEDYLLLSRSREVSGTKSPAPGTEKSRFSPAVG